MTRWLGLACGCVLVGAVAISGQQPLPKRGGGDGTNPQQEEVRQAREDLQRDIAEGKRLQDQLKLDQKSRDRDAVKRDQEALKANREKVKQDQEHIKTLTSGRGRGDGRGGRGDGRGGRGGRGRE